MAVRSRLTAIEEASVSDELFRERFPPETWAYREAGMAEYRKKTDEEYPGWLKQVKESPELEKFPYPNVKVESIFDKVEKTIEEW
jgi:hypothetical protein